MFDAKTEGRKRRDVGLHDVLMITYNRPTYTRLALRRLLDSCDSRMRVWLWHNGDHQDTLSVVRECSAHPAVHRFHVSEDNQFLTGPTNWFWQHADGQYLSKVDDDCLLPDGWGERLRRALDAAPELGVAGCWRFYEEDLDQSLVEKKLVNLPDGQRLMTHAHVQGSGYVMKRAVVESNGGLRERESFTRWCHRASGAGWLIGFPYPFVHEEHMDDARSTYYAYRTDEEFLANMPLSARRFGVRSLEEWRRRSAWIARQALEDRRPGYRHLGWRGRIDRGVDRLRTIMRRTEPWRG